MNTTLWKETSESESCREETSDSDSYSKKNSDSDSFSDSGLCSKETSDSDSYSKKTSDSDPWSDSDSYSKKTSDSDPWSDSYSYSKETTDSDSSSDSGLCSKETSDSNTCSDNFQEYKHKTSKLSKHKNIQFSRRKTIASSIDPQKTKTHREQEIHHSGKIQLYKKHQEAHQVMQQMHGLSAQKHEKDAEKHRIQKNNAANSISVQNQHAAKEEQFLAKKSRALKEQEMYKQKEQSAKTSEQEHIDKTKYHHEKQLEGKVAVVQTTAGNHCDSEKEESKLSKIKIVGRMANAAAKRVNHLTEWSFGVLDPNWVQLTRQKDWVRDWKKATLTQNVFEEKSGGIFVNAKGYKGVYLSTKDSKAITFLSYENDLKSEYNSTTGFTASQQMRTGCLSILMFLAPLAEVTP